MLWEQVQFVCYTGFVVCVLAAVAVALGGDLLSFIGLVPRRRAGALSQRNIPLQEWQRAREHFAGQGARRPARPGEELVVAARQAVGQAVAARQAARPVGVCCRCGAVVYDPRLFSRTSWLCAACVGERVIAGGRRGGRPRKGGAA